MRVIVNRIWKGHFGTGMVETPSNFGVAGERPSNPELLEYLARTFVKNGMSMKKLQREIMLSSVYQLGTENDEANYAKDSGNRMYWRVIAAAWMPNSCATRSCSCQAIWRRLRRTVGGSDARNFLRRTVYGKVSRYKLDTYLQTFDFPQSEHQRGEALHDHGSSAAPVPDEQRLRATRSGRPGQEGGSRSRITRARIKKIYQFVYSREPNEAGNQLGLEYLKTEPMKEYEEEQDQACR